MDSSSQEGEEKKKITEVKTLPVPFALGEIKENISIATNTPSQEQIIKEAFGFHSQGNISEAGQLYQNLINQGLKDHRVFSNYGVILKNLGKLQDAEFSTRKAIELNPHFADAHSNLGTILRDLGKSQDALNSYLKVIEIDPTNSNIYHLIIKLLKSLDLSKFNQSKLKEILNLLLDKNNFPHKELSKLFHFLYSNEIIENLQRFESSFFKEDSLTIFFNNKTIINALRKIPFKGIRLEKILTKTRKYICGSISENKKGIGCSQLRFIIALGEQCFLNEYIYSCSQEEKTSINKIITRCIDGKLNEKNISILSCYFPLYNLLDQIPSLKSFNSSKSYFKELMILQISEPLKEIELSKNIKKLGTIKNHISKKVKSQYEKNPYPRWRDGNPFKEKKFSINKAINDEIYPNYRNLSLNKKQLKILVAGCGTGQQILQSQRYQNAQVTGIDLSLSSLSYAQRKINELKIDNVQLIQMDILEVNLLEEKFDIILCSGVLHHMEDPLKGLKALLGILKPNGCLKLGLYSELARKDIVKARDYITTNNFEANNEDIKRFREDVFSSKIKQISNLSNWGDFYTMSECRDLCFHTQEHRFTIHELQETLQSNELEFLGFLLQQPVKSLYQNYFPEDKKQTNLQNWAKFEEKHTNTFRAMYQFWVCKT